MIYYILTTGILLYMVIDIAFYGKNEFNSSIYLLTLITIPNLEGKKIWKWSTPKKCNLPVSSDIEITKYIYIYMVYIDIPRMVWIIGSRNIHTVWNQTFWEMYAVGKMIISSSNFFFSSFVIINVYINDDFHTWWE